MIKNITAIDSKAAASINKISTRTAKLFTFGMIIIIVILGLLTFKSNIKLTIETSIVLIFLTFLFNLSFYSTYKSIDKANKRINKNTIFTYEFYQDFFSYDAKGDNENCNGKCGYSDLFRIIELKNYFFIYHSPYAGYIISKDGFEQKFHIDEFRHRLRLAKKKIKKLKI